MAKMDQGAWKHVNDNRWGWVLVDEVKRKEERQRGMLPGAVYRWGVYISRWGVGVCYQVLCPGWVTWTGV